MSGTRSITYDLDDSGDSIVANASWTVQGQTLSGVWNPNSYINVENGGTITVNPPAGREILSLRFYCHSGEGDRNLGPGGAVVENEKEDLDFTAERSAGNGPWTDSESGQEILDFEWLATGGVQMTTTNEDFAFYFGADMDDDDSWDPDVHERKSG